MYIQRAKEEKLLRILKHTGTFNKKQLGYYKREGWSI